ncbi:MULTISPECIES: heavy metal-binding domain-containing protein [Leptolyngbya]|uniref:heavy metal-binding domain-containing protein n=1 Tax=Leptolyngbya TaxID=47251 RepID=UPI0018F00467|nr:heavy metal-binding domain-containing protein [Leptolyngbya sp. FACHB-1624]
MSVITGLSGNEIFCLKRRGFTPGNLVIGNSVISLGVVSSIGSSIKTLIGGEIHPLTQLIHEGRQRAYARMVREAKQQGGVGITGASNQLIFHGSSVEFLSIGSCLHQSDEAVERLKFSSSADGQALYCQLDCGFQPRQFVFGNVAYSIGIGGGLIGGLRSLARGEIKEYSRSFNETRHLTLKRIQAEARQVGANAVVGITTSILPMIGIQEMVMIGTASSHDALPDVYRQTPITSDLTNEEM